MVYKNKIVEYYCIQKKQTKTKPSNMLCLPDFLNVNK